MNWYALVAAVAVFIGISPIPLTPAQAPSISWRGSDAGIEVFFTPSVTGDVKPARILNDSLGVDMTAVSAAMVALETGKTVYDKKSDTVRPIASITKLASLMVALDSVSDHSSRVEIRAEDHVPYGTTTLRVGETVSFLDLVAAAVIASDNTAVRALARSTGKSPEAFVGSMNEKAKELNLRHTRFSDVTGLSEDNVSTAADVLVLARTAFAYEDIGQFAGMRSYTFKSEDGVSHVVRTTNRLLGSFINVRFGKTGYVSESGFNLAALIADEAGHEYLGVVLGSATNDDRFQDMKMMAYWVQKNFSWSGI